MGGVGCRGGAPEVDILGAIEGAAGEEQRGAAAGEIAEGLWVGDLRPFGAVVDGGVEERGDRAHARAVFKLEEPEVVELRGEKLAGGGKEIEVEERVAVGECGRDFVREDAERVNLVAQGGTAEAVAAGVEFDVIGEGASHCGREQKPGGGDVVFGFAGDEGVVVGVEKGLEAGEPCFCCGEFVRREGVGVGQEAQGAGDFGEGDEIDDAGRRGDGFRGVVGGEGKLRGHARGGIDEPCGEMAAGAEGVAVLVGEDVRGGEGCDRGGCVAQGCGVVAEGGVGFGGGGIGVRGELGVEVVRGCVG